MSGIIALIAMLASIFFLATSEIEYARTSMMFAIMMMLVQINYNICKLAELLKELKRNEKNYH